MSSKVQHHRGVPGDRRSDPFSWRDCLSGSFSFFFAMLPFHRGNRDLSLAVHPATFAALVRYSAGCIRNIEAPAQMPGHLGAYQYTIETGTRLRCEGPLPVNYRGRLRFFF
jgi:hypothetical protein